MVEVIARKRSEDTPQEALRERKSRWNKEVKTLIAQLIAFKKGLNGRGDPRAGLPASDIKHPFPNEVGQYLDEMATRYSQVVSEAKQIITDQSNYSKSRRKSTREMSGEQLAASTQSGLEKQASWWGSRAWTWVTQYPILGGSDADRDRIALLNTTTALIDYLDEIDTYLAHGGTNSIPMAVYKLLAMQRVFSARFVKIFNRMMDRHSEVGAAAKSQGELPPPPVPVAIPTLADTPMPTVPESQPGTPMPTDPEGALKDLREILLVDIHHLTKLLTLARIKKQISDDDLKLLRMDYQLISKEGAAAATKIGRVLAGEEESEGDIAEALGLYSSVKVRYNKVLNAIRTCLEVSGEDFKQVLEAAEDKYKKEAAQHGPEIEKIAQKALKRWYRRMRLSILPTEDDRMKLDVVLKIQRLARYLDNMQDILESSSTTAAQILQYVADTSAELADITDLIHNLAYLHNATDKGSRVQDPKHARTYMERETINNLRTVQKYYTDTAKRLHSKLVVPR